jgi:3-phosphoshikimate 1-carboxyvinyltransferase
LNATITPCETISGEIVAPPSKAQTHRALFAALLTNGKTIIQNPLSCDDTRATSNSIVALGATLKSHKDRWIVIGNERPRRPTRAIVVGESGVTLRFSIPIASLTGEDVELKCENSLLRRPIQPLVDSMRKLEVKVARTENAVCVSGGPPLGGGVYIRGDVSSQFISGLLLAGPLMQDGLELKVTSRLESRGYVTLTIDAMNQHGISVEVDDQMSTLKVKSGQTYNEAINSIPGDYSSAAFPMAAAAITSSNILISGLSRDNVEPDSVIMRVLSDMGVETRFSADGVRIEGGSLKAIRVDVSDCPDLTPTIAVLGCYAEGKTEIVGAGRLQYKESNRLEAVRSELKALGAEIASTDERLLVNGPCSLSGGTVDSHGDHRIAMALSVAALHAAGPVTIRNSGCVSKSYPGFFDDLRLLGVDVIER